MAKVEPTSTLYPIFLRLRHRRALIVGGGRMAVVRARQLLAAGAAVTVISPRLCVELERFAASAPIRVLRRKFKRGDISRDYLIVVGATSHPPTQQALANDARQAGVLCNVVDAPRHCTYFTPAVVERGALQIAICSGGQSPVLSGRLRRILDDALPQSASDWTALFGKLRARLKKAFPDSMDRRRELINQFIEQATSR